MRRSKAMEKLRNDLWPGFDIAREVERHFGKNHMFFPLTGVSLNPKELGERDLKKRNIAPYGVIHPVLWLLHMNGFKVI
jgi:hypothetical protein